MSDETGDGQTPPTDPIAALTRSAAEVEAAARAVIQASGGAVHDTATNGSDWNPPVIMGHLCDGARVWGGRIRVLAREEEPSLEAFDEGLAIRVAGYHWKGLEPLLAEFRIVSEDTLAFLRGLPVDAWERTGRHPALGRVTIRDLARVESAHEQEHAQQLLATLARGRSA